MLSISVPIVTASGSLLSIGVSTDVRSRTIPPSWWTDSNLHNGLWYQDFYNPIYVQDTPQSPIYQVSFMKIYSLGGTLRVMELSTYPRAYMDKDPHVYTVDTPFVVTQDDLNDFYNPVSMTVGSQQTVNPGDFIFCDTHRVVWVVGDTAYHYAGDMLPGSFPTWIESESLPTPKWVDNRTTVLPAVFQAVKGELATYEMYEAYFKQDTDTDWTKMPDAYWQQLVTAFGGADTQVKINAKIGRDRLVVRLLYDRVMDLGG